MIGTWQRSPHGGWHLLRTNEERTYCGRQLKHVVSERFQKVPESGEPWIDFSCWSCMDVYRGVIFGR